VFTSSNFIAANDGVGAWSTKPGGHAGLWSRLIIHFWSLEIDKDIERASEQGVCYVPKPVEYLQRAYEQTLKATTEPNTWLGTTTAAGAQLHYRKLDNGENGGVAPMLYVTNLGDSQILVLRPRDEKVIFKTTAQWHWFDCPRQLGTNSPDTPAANAVMDKVEIEEEDVVLAMSDGVIDNLWEHEIVTNVVTSIREWENSEDGSAGMEDRKAGANGGMKFVANRLVDAARVIAQDPFAESPFMEHAIEEGLAMEGGELF
jgi:protein phosphatase PTC7